MPGRAIDKLRKAANLKSTRRLVVLDNGEEFEFYSTPLTMAQREKANRDAKSDDINQFALQLLLNKATDESGPSCSALATWPCSRTKYEMTTCKS